MSELKKMYEGKAKILYHGPQQDEVFVYFKDDTTAFNGEKMEQFQEKGEINLKITILIFRYLEKLGIPTHYLKPVDERTILAKKVHIIPVEFIVRNIATGSLLKRTPFKEGTVLSEPLLEYFYKSDELGDPLINTNHIRLLELCSEKELAEMSEYTLKINDYLSDLFKKTGIKLVDFKVEYGRTSDGEIVLADEISPDSCRLWDFQTMEKLDKDIFRKGTGDLIEKYKEVLRRLEEEIR